MAGRITLAKSVLAAIPTYFMQSSQLPSCTCVFFLHRLPRVMIDVHGVGVRPTHLVSNLPTPSLPRIVGASIPPHGNSCGSPPSIMHLLQLVAPALHNFQSPSIAWDEFEPSHSEHARAVVIPDPRG
ncbi:hypothetical protein V6N13_094132 [Hibiscus sabdariffa]